jgi:hypothetical protein
VSPNREAILEGLMHFTLYKATCNSSCRFAGEDGFKVCFLHRSSGPDRNRHD